MIGAVVNLVREKTGFDAVGIRLKKGEDYPYYETRGFPEEFVRAEKAFARRTAAAISSL